MTVRMPIFFGACLMLASCMHTATYPLVGWEGEKAHPDRKFVLSVPHGPRPTKVEFAEARKIVGRCTNGPPAPPFSEDERIRWCLVGGQIGANELHLLLNAKMELVAP